MLTESNRFGTALLLLRIAIGIAFVLHGTPKMAHASTWMDAMPHHPPAFLQEAAAVAEFFGGLGLIAGLLGRVAAVCIAVVMLSAIVMVDGRYGLCLNWFGDRKGHDYEYHLLAIALAAVIIVRGSGAMSLDRLLYISFV